MFKFLSKLFVTIFCLLVVMTPVAFASSNYVEFSFSTGGGGNGYVDGSLNGKFYSFNKDNTITISLTDSSDCVEGKYSVSLYIEDSWFGKGTYCGTNTFDSEPFALHGGTYSAPKTHSKYYLFVTGQGIRKKYSAYGSLSQ